MTTEPPPGSAPDVAPTRTLGTASKAWRLVAVVAALSVLTTSQFLRSNDFFPLGSLSQYAKGTDPDAPVRSTGMTALTTDGTEVEVSLNARGVGVERAEVEGQVQRIVDDPSLLEAIARGHAGLHPDEPRYVHITMHRTSQEMRDGTPTGESTREVLTEWTVRDEEARQ
ncbi:hypothetical protein [Sanguibacter suaedae]|uniref:Uncharacterized protein n=1 Tax=Sanguibacter suaedae TaxID=2795737 RepID=A0A934M9D4_9MICO|nr:hypothetical protein [Sanguibacter suaedae]MBI9114538.1 hypothetical protein [Sanguibacter suaedae]